MKRLKQFVQRVGQHTIAILPEITHFIVASVPRRRPHSANFERRRFFFDKVLALLRRYGTSKFWILYPVRMSGSATLTNWLHCEARP